MRASQFKSDSEIYYEIGNILKYSLFIGTPEERGIAQWKSLYGGKGTDDAVTKELLSCYDLPFIMPWIRSKSWLSYIPFSPTFFGWRLRQKKGMNSCYIDHLSVVCFSDYL